MNNSSLQSNNPEFQSTNPQHQSNGQVVKSNMSTKTGFPSNTKVLTTLVKKQCKMDMTNPKALLFRVFFPALYLFSAAGLKFLFQTLSGDALQRWEAFPSATFFSQAYNGSVYVGAADGVDVSGFLDALSTNFENTSMVAIESDFNALDQFQAFCFNTTLQAGVFFTQGEPSWEYSLFMDGQWMINKDTVFSPNPLYSPYQLFNPALGMQNLVENSIIESQGAFPEVPTPSFMQPMPKLNNYLDTSRWWVFLILGIFFGFTMQQAMNTYMQKLVVANLDGFPDMYHLMGVSKFVYWMHFVVQLGLYGLITSLAALGPILFLYPSANLLLFFVAFWFGYIHHVLLSVHIAPRVKTKDGAGGLAFLMVAAAMGLSVPLVMNFGPLPLYCLCAVLNPTMGLILIASIFAVYDVVGYRVGVTFANAWSSGVVPMILSQLVGIALYTAALYIVYGGFPWLSRLRRLGKGGAVGAVLDDKDDHHPKLEAIPSDSDIVVNVDNLYKSFGEKQVLRGFDMQVRRGEVYGFLGANGAGKSVTCKILAGEIEPTEGSVQFTFNLDGTPKTFDMRKDNKYDILRNTGFCMQHDTLVEEYTCREMLRHCCVIKGGVTLNTPQQSHEEAIEAEVNRLIEAINFTSPGDEDKPIKSYSGGMKRKVSIAMALVGDPEMIFLDEPTAGVDPVGRHAIWTMIEKAKQGRSIVLTTHFMDEADVLSDRIGVINEGRMVACGTSLFLKNEFGVGFNFSYDKPAQSASMSLGNIAPGATLKSSVARVGSADQVSDHWLIPLDQQGKIPQAIRAAASAGFANVTTNLTTLEQVFLKIGSDRSQVNYANIDHNVEDDADNKNKRELEEDEALLHLWKNHLSGSSYTAKRKPTRVLTEIMFKTVIRSGWGAVCTIMLPIVLMTTGFVVVYLNDASTSETLIVSDPYLVSVDLLYSNDGKDISPIVQPWTVFGLGEDKLNQPGLEIMDVEDLDNLDKLVEDSSIRYLGGQNESFLGEFNMTVDMTYFNVTRMHATSVLFGVYTNYSLADLGDSVSARMVPIPYPEPIQAGLGSSLMPSLLGMVALTVTIIPLMLMNMDEKMVLGVMRSYGVPLRTVLFSCTIGVLVCVGVVTTTIAVALGVGFSNPVMGNGGRWLMTLLAQLVYPFSIAPLVLYSIKVFPNAEIAGMVLPGLLITLIIIPGTVTSVIVERLNQTEQTQLLSVLTVFFSPFGFQNIIGGMVLRWPEFHTEGLQWADVWGFDAGLSPLLLAMVAGGTMYWIGVVLMVRSMEKAQDLAPDANLGGGGNKADNKDLETGESFATLGAPDAGNAGGISVRGVSKTFVTGGSCGKPKKVKQSVKNVTFDVAPNEVFILLGPNGAGKTTLCNTMIRNFAADEGGTRFGGMVDFSKNAFFKETLAGSLGFLPQVNVYFDVFSVRENFEIAAKLRGLNGQDPATRKHIEAVLVVTGLIHHEKKKPDDLSGGYKRRLCLGMSLIGHPKALIADEMSSGVDPAARAHIHEMFNRGRALGTEHDFELPAVLLSTHVMEEAKALGTKVGIMVNGALVASGSQEELSNKYCKFNYVEVIFQDEIEETPQNLEQVMDRLKQSRLEPMVKEQQSNRAMIRCNMVDGENNALQLASLYEKMEKMKSGCGIKYYAVSVMDLEQVFLDIVDENPDEDE